MRIARWAARLMRFNYTAEYQPGAQNRVADALSRLPLHQDTSPLQDDDEEVIIQSISVLLLGTTIQKTQLQQAVAADATLQRVIDYVSSSWPTKKDIDDSLRPYAMVQDELSVADNCLMRGDRFVIPESLQENLISRAHEAHRGIVRCKRLRDCYWWPCMDRMVEEAIRNCYTCQTNDKTARPRTAPLQPVPLPEGPWQKLA